MEGRGERRPRLLHFGMHVIDAHDQRLGTVILVRDDHFVMRQELGLNQLVAIPNVAISGVIGGMVFLNLTPGEIEIFGRTLERRERGSSDFKLSPRVVRLRPATDST
jgi:hypothetical protein